MQVRDLILNLLETTLDFRAALLRTAGEHLDSVITGYTHLQPAQPITMGHYLAGIEQALQRDTRRLFRTFENTNQCCLGAGALAGTGFPIDRQLVAALLGFDGLIVNTLDAVAGRDYLLELLADLSILAITLSRLAQDLYVWYTYEFGLIDLPDRLGGTSSIMPQKKNPIIMETCQGCLSHVLGGLASALAAIKNTNYTNRLDTNIESFHLLDESARQTEASLALLQAAVEGMEVRQERAYDMASANFSTVTELADTLVRERDYSFREAHHVVGAVVRKAVAQGLAATDITAAFIDEVLAAEGAAPAGLDDDQVRRALDPRHNVEVRAHDGGPAPAAVARSVDQAQNLVRRDRQQLEARRGALAGARESLRQAVSDMLA
jgi:argininosuccinate lyase